MVGGEQPVFDLALPVLNCFAKAVTLMGDHGAGQTTKMVNQICIAGLIQGLAEALNFSERSGLDTEKVLEVISKGASQSWQMENRGKTMVEGKYDYGFAVEWMRKDLGLCLTEGNRIGARLPVTALVDQFYQQIMLRGGARWDTSSLMQLLQQDNAASK
jgi:3-hydroxyisobutyrate dehydrogenase-like beta-hydroxyacid dehydrogenase